jgi:alanine dehydrogenase
MLIGVPTEVKQDEHRVGLTPTSVRELVVHGHQVLVQSKAGAGIGVQDTDYDKAGAKIAGSADEVFARADMIVKVKELQASENAMLREGQILFTYLHLAPDPEQTKGLVKSGVVAIGYETVTGPHNSLPLLSPMSEVAGRMAVQAGAHCLEREAGGAGTAWRRTRREGRECRRARRRRGRHERHSGGHGHGGAGHGRRSFSAAPQGAGLPVRRAPEHHLFNS